MPERKRFNGRGWRPAQYVADVVPMSIRSVHGHKKWPRNPGPLVESISPRSCAAQKNDSFRNRAFTGLRGRNREGPHCAARHGPRSSAHGRWRPSGGRTGWWRPRSRRKQSWTLSSPFKGAADRRIRSGDNVRIPDTSHNAVVCIAAFCLLQCNMALALRGGQTGKKKRPPEPAASAQCSVIPPIRRRLSAAGQARRNRGSPPPGGR